jgi:hypothetical protein
MKETDKSFIITLPINNLDETLYLNFDTRYISNYRYLYKTITNQLIDNFTSKLNNLYTIFYYKNQEKIYIYMTMQDKSLILNLEDINNNFYLIKSDLLNHEIDIIKINHSFVKKDWECWENNELYREIRNYLDDTGVKINNPYLMTLLNKNNIRLTNASDQLLNNKDFLLPLMSNFNNIDMICTNDSDHLLPEPIRYDEDIAIATFSDYHRSFMDLPKILRYNKNVVLAALANSNQICVLDYTSKQIKKEIARMNINIPPYAGSLSDSDEEN